MSPFPLRHEPAHSVLQHYAFIQPGDLLAPIGGGFSGARLWRLEGAGGTYCLKARPADPGRLIWIHALMNRARVAGRTIVPQVVPTLEKSTCITHAGLVWDLTTWMPGRADFYHRPTTARLRAACTALAHLHTAWQSEAQWRAGPVPAIQRRRQRVQQWLAEIRTGWQPDFAAADPVRPWAERAWHLLRGRIESMEASLALHTAASGTNLQPCLCDLWHDHVLFQEDQVTGLIDYDSVKLDHVAVDLARLLGSLAGDEGELRRAGLQAYHEARPAMPVDETLVDVLDRTGTLLALTNWLTWLYQDRRVFDDLQRVAGRLAVLVQRIDAWK